MIVPKALSFSVEETPEEELESVKRGHAIRLEKAERMIAYHEEQLKSYRSEARFHKDALESIRRLQFGPKEGIIDLP